MLTLNEKSRIDNSRTECVKRCQNIYYWVKKDLFGCFRYRRSWQRQWNRFERGRRNKNVNYSASITRCTASLRFVVLTVAVEVKDKFERVPLLKFFGTPPFCRGSKVVVILMEYDLFWCKCNRDLCRCRLLVFGELLLPCLLLNTVVVVDVGSGLQVTVVPSSNVRTGAYLYVLLGRMESLIPVPGEKEEDWAACDKLTWCVPAMGIVVSQASSEVIALPKAQTSILFSVWFISSNVPVQKSKATQEQWSKCSRVITEKNE